MKKETQKKVVKKTAKKEVNKTIKKVTPKVKPEEISVVDLKRKLRELKRSKQFNKW